jgi:hypothetical protein
MLKLAPLGGTLRGACFRDVILHAKIFYYPKINFKAWKGPKYHYACINSNNVTVTTLVKEADDSASQ